MTVPKYHIKKNDLVMVITGKEKGKSGIAAADEQRAAAGYRELRDSYIPQLSTGAGLGYELRCADPIPFDAEYTRDLGYGAVKFILSRAAARFGAIVSFADGTLVPLPFDKMLNPETKRMTVRRVNVDGEAYECACHYMIRLERADFEDPAQLKKLAASVSMTPKQFRERFGYVVGLE